MANSLFFDIDIMKGIMSVMLVADAGICIVLAVPRVFDPEYTIGSWWQDVLILLAIFLVIAMVPLIGTFILITLSMTFIYGCAFIIFLERSLRGVASYLVHFVLEVTGELCFLCWVRYEVIRRLYQSRQSHSGERTPLLSPFDHDESESRRLAQVFSDFPVVDVTAVDLSVSQVGVSVHSLPTCAVQWPANDVSHVAVLSWRWDTTDSGSSLNIMHVIHYAKSAGIRFLFIDAISIDQTLPSNELIASVARFGTLYSSIPVLVAYDDIDLKFEHVMARPWIVNEVKSMLSNPHKIVYVGHRLQGTFVPGGILQELFRFLPNSQARLTRFAIRFQETWDLDFSMCALEVLNGNVTMTNIYDFKFILPMLSEVLVAAEQLERNDYLLIVLLFACSLRRGAKPLYEVANSYARRSYTRLRIVTYLTPNTYSFLDDEGTTVRTTYCLEKNYIDLAGRTLGCLSCQYEIPEGRKYVDEVTGKTFHYTLDLSPGMERHVFDILGLDSEAHSRYLMQENERRAFLGQQNSGVRKPNIEVVESELHHVRVNLLDVATTLLCLAATAAGRHWQKFLSLS